MLLSIIIPVYNVEKYIEKCVLSALNQDFKSIFKEHEILLINDGSTDNSPQICELLSEKHSNVRVYNKNNGGLSDARNFGLQNASGKYVAFLDSDDFVKENSYLKLVQYAEKNDADIVIGNAITYLNDDNKKIRMKKRKKESLKNNGMDFLVDSINTNTMSMVSTLGVYKKTLIKNNNFYFEKGILHEDELWTPQIFLKAEVVGYLNLDFYYHVYREGSITNQKNKIKNANDLLDICIKLSKVYSKIENKRKRKVLENYLSMLYLNGAYIGKLKNGKNTYKLNKFFPLSKASKLKNILKSLLFSTNITLYYRINDKVKSICNKRKYIQ